MWLTSSSIGRKVVMSVTGACLVLFLTFHMLMNLVYVYDVMVGTPADGHYYDKVCEFLGTNWYALLGTAGLALLVVIHFIYALILMPSPASSPYIGQPRTCSFSVSSSFAAFSYTSTISGPT